MAKSERPEWFKFWRRNRRTLDIDQLSMESRGRIFTNMMRYFDSGDAELIELDTLESAMFNVLKINVDDSFSDFDHISRQNRENARKRWDATAYDRIQSDANDAEDRVQSTEVRSKSTEVGTKAAKPQRNKAFIPPTVEEIATYCQERKNGVNPQKVYDYYAAAKWKDSNGKPVKNWKQKIISVWETDAPKAQTQDKAPDLSWRHQSGGGGNGL